MIKAITLGIDFFYSDFIRGDLTHLPWTGQFLMIIVVASLRNVGATSPLSNPGIINLDYSPVL